MSILASKPPLDAFRYWARTQFTRYSKCVGFVESRDSNGDVGIGTCFHVGEGVFVTARHVVDGRGGLTVGFDDFSVALTLMRDSTRSHIERLDEIRITNEPMYHPDPSVDVACLRLDYVPEEFIPLGGHFSDYLGQYDLLLHRTLVMGYPPVPLSDRALLVASAGEVNAMTTLYGRQEVHFLVSSMARGGFSGGPVLVGYNELNESAGTALLGLVTEALIRDGSSPETGYMAVVSVDPIYECLAANNMLPATQAFSIGRLEKSQFQKIGT